MPHKTWNTLADLDTATDRIVGHNLFDFDLKFIYKRSIINGVRPSVESFARYRNRPLFDTMYEWERWAYGARIGLDKLARVLSLPSSKDSGVDGSKILEPFNAGRHLEIRDHCRADVELTRAIYRRMVFADGGFESVLDAERDLVGDPISAIEQQLKPEYRLESAQQESLLQPDASIL